ncbi:MAG TPA: AAA family ATPase, partial [Cyanobacteria bacterium UBA11368]|nr:AAA family ATPase [Cyanobacteria bacterium UBA11368]
MRSRFTLIVLVTPEEERALSVLKTVCVSTQRPCLTWDLADGFQYLTDGRGSLPSARDPLT